MLSSSGVIDRCAVNVLLLSLELRPAVEQSLRFAREARPASDCGGDGAATVTPVAKRQPRRILSAVAASRPAILGEMLLDHLDGLLAETSASLEQLEDLLVPLRSSFAGRPPPRPPAVPARPAARRARADRPAGRAAAPSRPGRRAADSHSLISFLSSSCRCLRSPRASQCFPPAALNSSSSSLHLRFGSPPGVFELATLCLQRRQSRP